MNDNSQVVTIQDYFDVINKHENEQMAVEKAKDKVEKAKEQLEKANVELEKAKDNKKTSQADVKKVYNRLDPKDKDALANVIKHLKDNPSVKSKSPKDGKGSGRVKGKKIRDGIIDILNKKSNLTIKEIEDRLVENGVGGRAREQLKKLESTEKVVSSKEGNTLVYSIK